MNFKFRKKEYRVERDAHQFILSLKGGGKEEAYSVLGYYSSAAYLIKQLLKLHLISGTNATEISTNFSKTCADLGKILDKAVKCISEEPKTAHLSQSGGPESTIARK